MNKTPKLRFKAFSGDWKVDKLKNLCSDFIVPMRDKPQVFDGDIPWCRIEDIEGKYLNGTKSNQYVSRETIDNMNLKVHPKGTLICSCSAAIGNNAITTTPLITNQTFIGLVCENINNEYLYYLMGTQKRNLEKIAGGTTIAYISRKKFEEFNITVPAKEEQEKIASFFSLIDDKISLQGEKVEALKDYKTGMMQKIFSRDLRFKDDDGRDYPEWEEKKLDDISECLDNKRKPLNSTERGEMQGDIPYYGANGVVDFVNDYIFDEDIILLAEDGGNFDDFATRPIAQLVTDKSWVNNHAHVLKAKYNTEFLFYSLVHKDIRKYINGTSRAKLNKSDMLDILVNVPKSLEEQKKIADVLGAIYSKIEKEQEKLDSLNEYKKGLLQQMFV